jgi:FkbM family methyltransferase
MSLGSFLARRAFEAAVLLGRPFGGIRPRRIYHWLARAGYQKPIPSWHTTGLGVRMNLSPFYQLDRSIIAFGEYDQPLHEFFRRFVRPGMVCIDAGANIGDSTLHLAKLVGPTGRVYAFEPAPFPRSRLAEHVAANNFDDRVSISPCALADHAGTATLSFSQPEVENQGMGSLVNHDNHVVTQSIEVPLQPLDTFVNEMKITKIDLIKVDIQGAEPMLLSGARATLARQRPVMCMELSPLDLAASGLDSSELVGMLEAIGYAVHVLGPDGTAGTVVASDSLAKGYRASNVICVPVPEGNLQPEISSRQL